MIETMFEHHGVVYRGLTSRDEFNDVIQEWAPVSEPSGVNCGADLSWSGNTQDRGPGEQQTNNRRWFLDKRFDVQERDVLEVTQGVNAPLKLLILGVMRATDMVAGAVLNHYECNVEDWHGELGTS